MTNPSLAGSRPDVATRKRSRGENEEFVIKACLRKFMVGDKNTKDKIVRGIRNRVDAFSHRIVLASRALSRLVKTLFDGKNDLNEVQLPDIFNTSFMRQLMLGTVGCSKPFKSVQDYFMNHPEQLYSCKRFSGDSNVYCHGAVKYITNMKNSFKARFRPRLNQYLNLLQNSGGLTPSEKVYALYAIMGWKAIPKDIEAMNIASRKHVINIVLEQRKLLGLEDKQEVTEAWLDKSKNLIGVLRQWVFFNRQDEFKPFDIVPISKIRHHFITVDNDSFLGILSECGMIENSRAADAALLWPSIFDCQTSRTKDKANKQTSNTKMKHFTGTIDSDGISVCIHYTRPKAPKPTPEEATAKKTRDLELFQDPNVRKLACDPGRTNIYTIVEVQASGKVKEYSLSRRRYYAESGIANANRETIKWSKSIMDNLKALSSVTTKGVDIAKHEAFMQVFMTNLKPIWTEYTKRRWADQRLRLYGGKKRTMAMFWNEVLGTETERQAQPATVIAYGSAKFAPGGKGEVSVPTSSAFKACTSQKNLSVVLIDEFRTSQICCKTERQLQKVKLQGGKSDGKILRGLLWCGSTSRQTQQGAFVNRDVNAALNILRCATQTTRPPILDRKLARQRLPVQSVGKFLVG